jgi:hypothetical protein
VVVAVHRLLRIRNLSTITPSAALAYWSFR